MYDPQNPAHATMYAQAIYAKLQKLSEDIQLQHSIINAQKETVLKSRQRVYVANPKPEAQSDPTHAVYAHADTVVQHRAMIIKHYELIQQHKQMVKAQGIHVQNLTSTLLNIQQETNVVDELMNTKMAETRIRTPPTPSPILVSSADFTPPSLSELSSPIIPSSPDICGVKPISKDAGQNKRKATFQQATQNTQLLLSSLNEDEEETNKDDNNKEDKNNTIHVSFVSSDNESAKEDPQITSITVTTMSTSTSSTPTSKSLSTITVSSVSTSTTTTTTATTTTTTTFNPSISSSSPPPIISGEGNEPLPLSP